MSATHSLMQILKRTLLLHIKRLGRRQLERDFSELLNNSNFGNDCPNNIDNCVLEPLYDDIAGDSFIKKFKTIFNDDTYRQSLLLKSLPV